MNPEERKKLVEQHVALALQDGYGHGTHVAGIIAGGLEEKTSGGNGKVRVFERTFKSDETGTGTTGEIKFSLRPVREVEKLRGVAPYAKLVSLRVLDDAGEGYASDIIRALERARAAKRRPEAAGGARRQPEHRLRIRGGTVRLRPESPLRRG